MKASRALVAGVSAGAGLVATEAFVFNPAVASPAACRSAAPRRQQLQQTRRVSAAAAVAGGADADADAATAAAVVEEDDEGGEWVDALWDGKRWPARSEDYYAMPEGTKNWEVDTERLPVWEDEPNPVKELTGKDWYETFKPSEVEIEAAETGFNWTEEWFEENGITREDLPSEEEEEGKK